jgi:hypothetical protein
MRARRGNPFSLNLNSSQQEGTGLTSKTKDISLVIVELFLGVIKHYSREGIGESFTNS